MTAINHAARYVLTTVIVRNLFAPKSENVQRFMMKLYFL